MEAHSANILRKSGRGASREGGICSGRSASRAGGICSGRCGPLGAARAGGELLFRRGRHRSLPFPDGPVASPCGAPVPAWTLCSGEAGMEPLPFPNGAGRIPRTEPLFRRGPSLPAGPVASSYGSPPFPDGPVASPGRKASHLRAQRPPEGARCSVFGLFLSFSAASRRAGTDAVCKSAVSPLGKSEKVVFLFLLYN